MEKVIKREYILDGLGCAGCAIKIEDNVSKIEGVAAASVNFATKTLLIEVEDGSDMGLISEKTKKIVKNLEPDVIVKEKNISTLGKKSIVLNGLDCASCADKIERAVNQLDGVKLATVDFATKKLILEVQDKHRLAEVVDETKRTIKRIEPDIKFGDESHDGHDHDHGGGINKGKIIRVAVGALIFFAAIILNLPPWGELAMFLISYLLVGSDVVIRAIKNIARGQVFDENFLMSIATIGAFAIREYPEGVAVMLFYQIGEFFQDIAVNRSRKSIADLMDIRPDYANLMVGGESKRVSPEEVGIGDIILVKPGEKIPLDGRVIEGSSMIDTSALTGESVPREVETGAEVLSGTINKNGLLTIEVTKEFGESAVSKILDLVQNASSKKAPTENFITKFARYYTPAVVFAAVAMAFIPPLAIPGQSFAEWINRALVFLVVSCPCALVISIPLGFFGGIGGASRRGILVKGSNYLEALNNVDTVVFDKTGTLTKGVFKVTAIAPEGNVTEEELLEYAAFAESHSNHPIALSIIDAYSKEVDKTLIGDYEEISGHGIKVTVKGKEVLAGNSKLMKRENISYQQPESIGTVVHMAIDGVYSGYIIISDEVKEDSKRAARSLKEIGVLRIVMLTGDSKAVADKIGKDLNLDEVHAELLPDQKVEKVELLSSSKPPKGKLIFVGDGINDAPVLARADVGVAMGGIGSDAAIEAADVVLMTDEPSKLVDAIKIAKRTRHIVWQNIVFSMAVKGIVLILGAGGIATMWEAVFADVGVALLAVLNAMRVMKTDKL